MDFSQLRELGEQLKDKAVDATKPHAMEWSEKAVTRAVDTTLNVIELAVQKAAERDIKGGKTHVSAAVNIGIVELNINVEFSREDLEKLKVTAASGDVQVASASEDSAQSEESS